jgi:outer membrane protein assembly factor BamD
LGKQELADAAVKVLAANYPDYPSLDSNGNFDYDARMLAPTDTFLSKLTFGWVSRNIQPGFDTRQIYNRAAQEES